ncbi:hypothetical protein GF366_01460 [Candidatus Peregrinibacteria bacterium]|nr:hypothetical protein [Candidatus Peregrinibacteria bacterium]
MEKTENEKITENLQAPGTRREIFTRPLERIPLGTVKIKVKGLLFKATNRNDTERLGEFIDTMGAINVLCDPVNNISVITFLPEGPYPRDLLIYLNNLINEGAEVELTITPFSIQ